MSTRYPVENRQILQEASAWFVEFRHGEDGLRRREFMSWLRRSPEHIRAYLEVSTTYAKLPHTTASPDPGMQELIERTRSRVNVVPLDAQSDASNVAPLANHPRSVHAAPRSRNLLAAAAAAILCAGAALASWLVLTRAPVYSTQTAEHRSITLEDGSRIELNARSTVRVRLTATERTVELLDGQALFRVAKDEQRPFIVRTGAARVRAVGTRFDVHLRKAGTIVTVLEGSVAVQGAVAGPTSATLGGSTVKLAAGEQAIVDASIIARTPRANVDAAIAWTKGEFEFDETRLADVVEEFNRHSFVPLVIESPALEDFRISGIYSFDDPASLLRFLRNQPDILVVEDRNGMRLSRR